MRYHPGRVGRPDMPRKTRLRHGGDWDEGRSWPPRFEHCEALSALVAGQGGPSHGQRYVFAGFGSLGKPNTISPTMLRCTCEVPA